MTILEVKKLAAGREGKPVFRGLDFSVNAGDYLCIVGENGAGKSTLVRTLLGLLSPIEGDVHWHTEGGFSGIGYLPQQSQAQKDFPATAKEVVLSGCQAKEALRPFYSKASKQLAAENMERLGIAQLANRCYREMSGGQQQRVLLARALCAADKVLLLDEPVAGLDPQATADMYALIQKLNAEGMTILMVSHDVNAALGYASHVLHLGRTMFFGTQAAYLAQSGGFSAQIQPKGGA